MYNFKILKIIYELNTTLSKRVKKFEWFYITLIGFACLFLGVIIGVPLFTKLVKFRDEMDFKNALNFIPILVLLIDLIPTILRYQYKTLIEKRHLSIFPIKRLHTLWFHYFLWLSDIKNATYIVCLLSFQIYFLALSMFIGALLSSLLWLFFFLTVITGYLILFELYSDVLMKYRQHAISFFFLLLILVNAIRIIGREDFYSSIPITSFVGNGLYALSVGNFSVASWNLLLLLSSFSIGVSLLIFLNPKRR